MLPVCDVIDAEYALSAIDALPPETEKRHTQVQCELCCVRVKRSLPPADSEQCLNSCKDPGVIAGFIGKAFNKIVVIPLMSIDGPLASCVVYALIVVTGA